ncbi:DoxX family protein [Shewanella baltica]|uniref:DoxX family protein n=1 Tax=Shewanella baltica TaxID=62322 RepID=UPI00217E8B48|nr:DoxX family protein [Shewanella baltica]MCS6122104.1 DoxX family protein [Shewanella baltica]
MKALIAKTLKSAPSLAPLALRIPIGIILIAHGSQKLFGWFGGYGLEGTGQWMASIGLTPGYLMALMAGSSEFFGGLFLANNGYEFGLALLAATVSLAVSGAGKFAIDNLFANRIK